MHGRMHVPVNEEWTGVACVACGPLQRYCVLPGLCVEDSNQLNFPQRALVMGHVMTRKKGGGGEGGLADSGWL